MDERIVLSFDICSSSVIMEDLHISGTISKYGIIISKIVKYLDKASQPFHFSVYKFLGDGFLLIFDPATSIEEVLTFTIGLTKECNLIIDYFIDNYIENQSYNLPRKGITVGIDKGKISRITCYDREEYIGRPIVFASRLQSSLSKPEHVNKALLSLKVYNEIEKYEFKKLCLRVQRTFKNLRNDQELKCYEFTPSFYEDKDVKKLRKSMQEEIKAIFVADHNINKSTEDIYNKAINHSVIISEIEDKDK